MKKNIKVLRLINDSPSIGGRDVMYVVKEQGGKKDFDIWYPIDGEEVIDFLAKTSQVVEIAKVEWSKLERNEFKDYFDTLWNDTGESIEPFIAFCLLFEIGEDGASDV